MGLFIRPWTRVAAGFGILSLLLLAGCNRRPSVRELDRVRGPQLAAAEALRSRGATVREVHLAQGEAWSVGMAGMQITDELLDSMNDLRRVAELDFSKSTITDDQLTRLTRKPFILVNVDFSHTNISDAGLEKLEEVPVLVKLVLIDTKVTPQGIASLKKARQENNKLPDMFKFLTVVTKPEPPVKVPSPRAKK